MNEKINYIYKIRENYKLLKQHKIKKIQEDVEINLGDTANISLKTFFSLCIIYKINILILYKHSYFEYIYDNTEPLNIIEFDDNTQLYMLLKQQNVGLKANKIKVYSIDKIMKSVGSYTKQELIDICSILKLPTDKRKNELYEEIVKLVANKIIET
jgi:hypothetical protein